eukprot:g37466.t1
MTGNKRKRKPKKQIFDNISVEDETRKRCPYCGGIVTIMSFNPDGICCICARRYKLEDDALVYLPAV